MRPQPTPQAIAAAERYVRQTTGAQSWRYQSGQWFVTVRMPSGELRTQGATPAEKTQFDGILRYYETVHPAPRRNLGQRLSAGLGATPLGGAARGVGRVASAATGVLGVGGAVLGGAGAIGGAVVGAVGGALKLGLGVLTGALAVGGGVVYGFVRAVQGATREMIQVSREITSIRDNTGRDVGLAQGGYYSLRAAGLSGANASSFLGGDMMRGGIGKEVAGAYGLPDPTSSGFAAAFARKSQGMNIFEKRQMADTLSGGKASSDLLRLQNTRPEIIEREQTRQSRTQGALGVTPEMIRRLSDEYPLMQNRASMFIETIKMRFIGNALPVMEKGMDWLTSVMEKNSSKISDAIQRGVRWLFVDGVTLILDGARFGLSAFEMLTNGIFMVGDAIVVGLHAFAAGENSFMNFFVIIAKGIDMITGGAQDFAIGATYVKTLMNNLNVANPIVQGARAAARLPLLTVKDEMTEAKKTYQSFPASHFNDQIEAFRKSGKPLQIADTLENGIKAARGARDRGLSGARSGVDEFEKFIGSESQRSATLQNGTKELIGVNKETGKATVDELRGVRREISQNGRTGSEILDGLKDSIATDMFTESF